MEALHLGVANRRTCIPGNLGTLSFATKACLGGPPPLILSSLSLAFLRPFLIFLPTYTTLQKTTSSTGQSTTTSSLSLSLSRLVRSLRNNHLYWTCIQAEKNYPPHWKQSSRLVLPVSYTDFRYVCYFLYKTHSNGAQYVTNLQQLWKYCYCLFHCIQPSTRTSHYNPSPWQYRHKTSCTVFQRFLFLALKTCQDCFFSFPIVLLTIGQVNITGKSI